MTGQQKKLTMLVSVFSPVYQTTREFTALGFYNDAQQKYQVLFTTLQFNKGIYRWYKSSIKINNLKVIKEFIFTLLHNTY